MEPIAQVKRKLPVNFTKLKGKPGRPPNSPNRATADVRKMFSLFVERNIDGAQLLYDRVAESSPARALSILSRMSEFVLPKLSRVESVMPPELSKLSAEIIRDGRAAAAAYQALRRLDPRAPYPTLTFAAKQPEAAILAAPEPVLEAQAVEEPPTYKAPPAPALEPDVACESPDAPNFSTWERLGE